MGGKIGRDSKIGDLETCYQVKWVKINNNPKEVATKTSLAILGLLAPGAGILLFLSWLIN